ncbi:hypothetical protein GCM10027060_08480 [Nesterenkonia halophila]|uniref:hypothetical protein n=1 Tax=Nesterenkonia halophila TaxID=302044 RepID=UPI0012928A51|nr:hypothetical protein [Nesterenkonia halophila]
MKRHSHTSHGATTWWAKLSGVFAEILERRNLITDHPIASADHDDAALLLVVDAAQLGDRRHLVDGGLLVPVAGNLDP